jgi:glutamate-1-semialdehyde 2,1-aminomutase
MAVPALTATSDDVDRALDQAHARFVARRPQTAALHQRARAVLPGGNTRTVLYHRPFPLRVTRAWDAVLEDADGHRYVDLLGEYSAGLYGHSHPVLLNAMTEALREGISRGTHTAHEVRLAEAVCARFPAVERVRFTNSGTEANLMALSAARAHTRRERVMVFRGGYHGSLLNFLAGPSRVNAPYQVLIASYNDTDGAVDLLRSNAGTVGCVLVEPMLGSGGCLPGEVAFLTALRQATTETVRCSSSTR